jgi:hypothetical protein
VRSGCERARRDADEQERRDGERDGVHREEGRERKHREEHSRERPAADAEGAVGRADEGVRLLDVPPRHHGWEERTVCRLEVVRGRLHHERGDHERPQWQLPREAGDGDRHERRRADEISADHHPPPIEPIGDEPAVEAEQERRTEVALPEERERARRPGRDRVGSVSCASSGAAVTGRPRAASLPAGGAD